VENCTFCDLGFNPVWAARTASCQHLYHDWCCRFVFETSTTCVAPGCGTEMHEGWWACAGLIKPGQSANQVNPAEMFSRQTSAPQHAGEFLRYLSDISISFLFLRVLQLLFGSFVLWNSRLKWVGLVGLRCCES
jgi:hypothetical protein